MLVHPEIASRSCEDCKKWMYDDNIQRMGPPVILRGEKVERSARQKPKCEWCPKIPLGVEPCPENAEELSLKNVDAFLHYKTCKAVGAFPLDPIVYQNARIIREVEDLAERAERRDSADAIAAALIARFGRS